MAAAMFDDWCWTGRAVGRLSVGSVLGSEGKWSKDVEAGCRHLLNTGRDDAEMTLGGVDWSSDSSQCLRKASVPPQSKLNGEVSNGARPKKKGRRIKSLRGMLCG